MKIHKVLLLFLIAICSISCNKEDISYSLENTYWVANTDSTKTYGYALSFSNGYVQDLYLDNRTKRILFKNFSAKYELKGNKILITKEFDPPTPSETYEASFEDGVIHCGHYDYYLQ